MPTFLRLELENFKSYRTPTTIEWKQVSSIIGQNGTGKSTIIDAVEFVFCFPCYQKKSVENLRNELYNKNSEDNEHSSSWVSAVVIVNGEEREFKRAIDYNESIQKYWVNDRMVSHNEYTKFLMEVNINPRANNFLVQQNTIESLALKNAKQRTKFFEVLSNSIVYKSEYDRYKSDMGSMEIEVSTLKNIMNLHSREKKNVILKSQEIQLYDELTGIVESLEFNYYLTKLYEIEFTVQRLHSEEIEKKRTMMEAEKLVHEYQTNIETFSKEIAEHEGQITDIERKKEKLQPTILKHKNEVETLKEKIKMYDNKIEGANKQFEQAKNIHNQHLKIIEDLKKQLCEIQNQKDALDKLFAQPSSLELDMDQYTEYCNLRNQAEKQITKDFPHISTLERERDRIRDQINEYENQTKILLDQIKIEKLIIKGINDNKQNVCQKIDEMTSKLNEADIKNRELVKEIEQLRSSVEATINKIQDCNKQLSNMDVEKHESNNQRRLQEIENTLKLKFGDKILGRLTNLCGVKSRIFEIAITKILGNNMDAIIVDTTETATECITYVKEQYSGDRYPAIAKYIPMDQLQQKTLPHGILKYILIHHGDYSPTQHLNSYRKIESTSYAVLAMNVMNSGQYGRLLNSLLGDIVISKTHDQAMELSKSLEINCVSQDGTYFRKNGLFSGGCKDLAKKARKWSDTEYTKIETEKETETKLLRELQCQLRDKECGRNSEIQRCNHCLEEYLKPKFEKLEQELSMKEKNLAELENKLQALKSASKIDDLKRSLEPINSILNQYEQRRREIEDKVFIEFCEKHELTDIRKYEETNVRQYQDISGKIMEFDQHLGKIQNQLAYEKSRNTKENLKKFEKMLLEMTKEKEALSNQLKEQGSYERKYKKFSEYEKKIKSIRCDIAKKKKNLLIKKRAFDKAKEDVNAFKKSIAGLNFKMNQLQRVEVHQILTTCKMKGIDIALKKGTIEKVVIDSRLHDTESETSGQNTESDSAIQEKNVEIDFSKLEKKVEKFDETELHNFLKDLKNQRQELASQLEACTPSNRNLKEELDSVQTKMKAAKADWKKKKDHLTTIRQNFEKVQNSRKKLFLEFCQSVETEIDMIFKDLYNQDAAQALLIAKNAEEPYLDGIDLSVLIPGKKWTKVENLSGGEKTMCAMALFLAIYKAKPAPCIIFDEIDAALDNANLQNIVTLFMQWKQTTQIISISHHENFFRCSDAAIGISTSALRNSSYAIHVDLNSYLQPVSWSPRLPYSPRTPTGSSRKPLTSTPDISLNRNCDVRLPSLPSSSRRSTMEPPTVPHTTSSGIIIKSVENVNVRLDNVTIRKRKIRKSEEDDS